jgi:hypothetical protein
MLGGYELGLLGAIPVNKTLKFVSVRAIGLEGFLIKKALNSTTEADLVGISLSTNGPTHSSMPAPSEENDRHSC